MPHSQVQDLVQHEEQDEDESLAPQAPKSLLVRVYHNNTGVFMILLAQVAGSTMDAIARFLQLGGGRMHPFQIIFARMSVTLLLSSLYMWATGVPDFPLGKKGVRGLLAVRALFGFFGLWCLYYSVHYLALAEATVVRFLVPIITAWTGSKLLGTSFTWKELSAGVLALVGVVIIAHPAAIFGDEVNRIFASTPVDEVTPRQRLIAICIAISGVLGASGAYTLIRVIGDRAHALISVNYFALVSTVGSTLILLITPGIEFVLPQNPREWVLLSLLGVLGFVLQFLLTAGLQRDKSFKATSMLYSGVVFALIFDWGIWGVIPGIWSLIGGAIVIASTLWAALQKPQKTATEVPQTIVADEETALLSDRLDDARKAAQRRRGGVTT